MELQSIKISQYAGGFVATGYNIQGLSIIDGEQQANIEDAVNSLLRVMNETERHTPHHDLSWQLRADAS